MMGKKVLKRKTGTICLEPDGYSIHTFELSRRMTKAEWHDCKNKLYEKQRPGENWIYPDEERPGCHHCKLYAKKEGIRIRLEHNAADEDTDTYFIRMIVNPRRLIGLQSAYLGILPPDETSIELLEKAFDTLFRGSPIEGDIRRYYLSRVDLCTNIRCSDKRVFRELVRVLRKTATPKKYERRFYRDKNKDKKKENRYNKHYIRIACDTQELVIYDKTYQMLEKRLITDYEKLPAGVLRVEVHYLRGKLRAVEKRLRSGDPLDVLGCLMRQSRERICRLARKCYPALDYLSYEKGIERIRASRFRAEAKNRMLLLLEQMQRRQTIDAALIRMQKQKLRTDDLLSKFEKLSMSPVPLRKGYAACRMPSLSEILRTVDDRAICIEMAWWQQK